MAPDDAVNGGQPQPAARELRCEEGIEYPFQRLPVHAATGVGHFQARVESFRQVVFTTDGGEILLRAVDRIGGHGNHARQVTQGLRGINHEVHEHLANLGDIGLNPWKIGGQIPVQYGLLGDGDLQHSPHVFYASRKVYGLDD